MVAFGFLSQHFGRWRGLCHSMNEGSVVGIPWGGGDTQTLTYVKEFVWTFCTYRNVERPSHIVGFFLPNSFQEHVPDDGQAPMVCRHLPGEPTHLARSVPPLLIVILVEQHHVHLVLELSPVPQRISVVKTKGVVIATFAYVCACVSQILQIGLVYIGEKIKAKTTSLPYRFIENPV